MGLRAPSIQDLKDQYFILLGVSYYTKRFGDSDTRKVRYELLVSTLCPRHTIARHTNDIRTVHFYYNLILSTYFFYECVMCSSVFTYKANYTQYYRLNRVCSQAQILYH
jgi:hypothetical protein